MVRTIVANRSQIVSKGDCRIVIDFPCRSLLEKPMADLKLGQLIDLVVEDDKVCRTVIVEDRVYDPCRLRTRITFSTRV